MKKSKFFTTDITVGAGATYTTTTPAIDTSRACRAVLQARATGANGGSAGTITFHIAAVVGDQSPAAGHSTSDLTTVTVVISGTTPAVGVPVLIDCDGLTALECTSVVNGDAGFGIADVNLYYGLVGRPEEHFTQSG